MKKLEIRIAVVMLVASMLTAAGAEPIRIESGQVTGVILDEKTGLQVFRGIPCAAPPVGELRWRPPVSCGG